MEEQNQNQVNSNTREAVDESLRKIEEYAANFRRELENVVPPVKEFIVKHPLGSLSTILGVGVVVGYLIGSSRRND
ncbi:MAG: hypothetical protein OXE92_09500 [Bacteroidetes bacterium]|nr:hypothetical protein [Bacteroidota bacterium]MCY4205943.1 hypothetical protein [Bacteroidota bacterium]